MFIVNEPLLITSGVHSGKTCTYSGINASTETKFVDVRLIDNGKKCLIFKDALMSLNVLEAEEHKLERCLESVREQIQYYKENIDTSVTS